METILREIEQAIDAGLYYLAISATLTLPEICAALESTNGSTAGRSQASYETWYNTNLADRSFSFLTATDCWRYRCGASHQGQFGHPEAQYGRVIFTLPHTVKLHNNIINDALNLDAVRFCRELVAAVRVWFATARHNPTVQRNLLHLVQLRPNGHPPYIGGIPVIS